MSRLEVATVGAPPPDPLGSARPLAVWPAFVLFGLALVLVSAGGFVIAAVSVIGTLSSAGLESLRSRAGSPLELVRAFLATPPTR